MAVDDRDPVCELDFDHLIDDLGASAKLVQQRVEKFPLPGWRDLRDNDEETAMQLLPRIELPKITQRLLPWRFRGSTTIGHQCP